MEPQPNANGVYEEDQWTDRIQHTTASGAFVAVMLVRCADGWRWGIDYRGQWCGGGRWPSVTDHPLQSRQEAMDVAIARLRRVFGPPYCHEPSDTELRQETEIRTWCDSQKQLELFA